ncbi:MAG: sensor histidine kinase [Pseudobdellovibrio sp.]
MFNKMLKRQLKKLNIDENIPPENKESWNEFLDLINLTYDEYELHLQRSNNTLNVATEEMQKLYKELETNSRQTIQSLDAKLQNIMISAPCIIIWLDQNGIIEGCNEQFKKMISSQYNFQSQNLTCKDIGFNNLHQKILEFSNSSEKELSTIITLNVNDHIYHYKITFNYLEKSKISAIGFDLTEDIQKQNTINDIQAKAIQNSKLAVLGEMAAGIAHEINNPLMILTSITFLVQRHVEQSKFEQIPDKLSKIQDTISRISRIVNGLRTFARDGEKDPFMPTDISYVINESLELCRENLLYKKVNIIYENPFKIPIIVDCRETQISQVIINLISNAADAISNVTSKWIKISLEKDEKNLFIKVIDSGNGISQEIHEKIFQPFFTTKDVGSGTGLGLSISRGIAQSHNGQLYLDDAHSNTCFVLQLPLSQHN